MTICIVVIILWSPVVATNYIVDNHSLLRNPQESRELRYYFANMRASDVGVRYSYNDRSIKLLVAQESTAECLAIGSSHAMTLRQSNNPYVAQLCASLDNVGVTGASFEDVITFLAIGAKNPKVKTMIIGVDLWTLNRNTRLNWMRNNREMFAAREQFGLSIDPYSDVLMMASSTWIEQLFSFKYLITNYKFMKRAWEGKTSLTYDGRQLVESDLKQELALRSDASLSYPQEFAPTPAIGDLGTTDQWIEPPYFDSVVEQEFRSALSAVTGSGKEVVLFMAPYHPYVTQSCPKPHICEAIEVIEPLVTAISRDAGLPLLGSYLPEPLGLQEEDFIDFQHIRSSAWKSLSLFDTSAD